MARGGAYKDDQKSEDRVGESRGEENPGTKEEREREAQERSVGSSPEYAAQAVQEVL